MGFDNIYAQLAGCAGKRQPTGTTLKALELPADGSPLSLIQLKTIEADAHLFREPDLTALGGLNGLDIGICRCWRWVDSGMEGFRGGGIFFFKEC